MSEEYQTHQKLLSFEIQALEIYLFVHKLLPQVEEKFVPYDHLAKVIVLLKEAKKCFSQHSPALPIIKQYLDKLFKIRQYLSQHIKKQNINEAAFLELKTLLYGAKDNNQAKQDYLDLLIDQISLKIKQNSNKPAQEMIRFDQLTDHLRDFFLRDFIAKKNLLYFEYLLIQLYFLADQVLLPPGEEKQGRKIILPVLNDALAFYQEYHKKFSDKSHFYELDLVIFLEKSDSLLNNLAHYKTKLSSQWQKIFQSKTDKVFLLLQNKVSNLEKILAEITQAIKKCHNFTKISQKFNLLYAEIGEIILKHHFQKLFPPLLREQQKYYFFDFWRKLLEKSYEEISTQTYPLNITFLIKIRSIFSSKSIYLSSFYQNIEKYQYQITHDWIKEFLNEELLQLPSNQTLIHYQRRNVQLKSTFQKLENFQIENYTDIDTENRILALSLLHPTYEFDLTKACFDVQDTYGTPLRPQIKLFDIYGSSSLYFLYDCYQVYTYKTLLYPQLHTVKNLLTSDIDKLTWVFSWVGGDEKTALDYLPLIKHFIGMMVYALMDVMFKGFSIPGIAGSCLRYLFLSTAQKLVDFILDKLFSAITQRNARIGEFAPIIKLLAQSQVFYGLNLLWSGYFEETLNAYLEALLPPPINLSQCIPPFSLKCQQQAVTVLRKHFGGAIPAKRELNKYFVENKFNLNAKYEELLSAKTILRDAQVSMTDTTNQGWFSFFTKPLKTFSEFVLGNAEQDPTLFLSSAEKGKR